MEAIRISGPARVTGEVSLQGAKNAALPALVAAFAVQGPVQLENMPTSLHDLKVLIRIFRKLGADVRETSPGTISIGDTAFEGNEIDAKLAGSIRSSLLFLGLFAGLRRRIRICLPGGCQIGLRQFDLHLMGLRAMGATVNVEGDTLELKASDLRGADISLPIATTSGTENLMIAACFAKGRTRILNAHTRPEVVDVAKMLNAFGADIRVSQRKIEINGGKPLRGGTYRIMPAWDEAVTVMAAAVLTGGEVCVRDMDPGLILGDISVLRAAGAEVFSWGGHIFVKGPNRPKPIHVVTGPFPGINSDIQPICAAMCTTVDGESTVTDTRFPERFAYVHELRKLGADIDYFENCVVIRGVGKLIGTHVCARDLRCGAAVAVAALAAEGDTVITDIHQLDRGYAHFEKLLRALGVSAERIQIDHELAKE